MRILTSPVALAAMALSLALTALPASAAGPGGTMFDLGIDVTQVPLTTTAVNAYIASLAPETQSVIMSSCEHYAQNPIDARSLSTVDFCRIAVGG